jgi:hypothetical protein
MAHLEKKGYLLPFKPKSGGRGNPAFRIHRRWLRALRHACMPDFFTGVHSVLALLGKYPQLLAINPVSS